MNKAEGIFASADAAYVLAYSVILLTTDLHSEKARPRALAAKPCPPLLLSVSLKDTQTHTHTHTVSPPLPLSAAISGEMP